MKRAISIAIVSAIAFASAPSFAMDKSQLPPAIQAELKDLKKKAGAGEISSKEYNERKQALLADVAQQSAQDMKR